MAAVEPRKVKCPQCGGPAVYAPENAFRPFCSQRCKMIDLGNWASENYRVPLAEDQTSSDQNDAA